MNKIIVLVALIALFGASAAWPGETKSDPAERKRSVETNATLSADEHSLVESAEAFVSAFNNGDAEAVAALWTPDCEYYDETGKILRNRGAVEKEYAAFFAANPGLKIDVSVSSINIVDGKAAVETGVSTVEDSDGDVLSKAEYAVVHVKRDGRWFVASVRERALQTISQRPGLEDLDWLLGDWGASNDSRKAGIGFKWIAHKKVIVQHEG